MAIVLLFDQRNSSRTPDLVRAAAATLNGRFTAALSLGFVRTAGDEMQAVLADADALVALLDDVLDSRAWWTAIGLGTITRFGASARESAGPAFRAARDAIEAAKRDRSAPGPAVRGQPAELAESLQAAFAGLAFIRAKRTDRQREVVATVRAVKTRKAAGQQLEITHQAVSDALAAAGYDTEQQLRGLVTRLAIQATGG